MPPELMLIFNGKRHGHPNIYETHHNKTSCVRLDVNAPPRTEYKRNSRTMNIAKSRNNGKVINYLSFYTEKRQCVFKSRQKLNFQKCILCSMFYIRLYIYSVHIVFQ